MYIYVYIYIYIYIYIYLHIYIEVRVRVNTMLLVPILYGVWHTKGGGRRGKAYIAQSPCNSIATVWEMQAGGGNYIYTHIYIHTSI